MTSIFVTRNRNLTERTRHILFVVHSPLLSVSLFEEMVNNHHFDYFSHLTQNHMTYCRFGLCVCKARAKRLSLSASDTCDFVEKTTVTFCL